ncbi:MAG: hypothetical protein ACLT1C_07440 [Weissella confusa]
MKPMVWASDLQAALKALMQDGMILLARNLEDKDPQRAYLSMI